MENEPRHPGDTFRLRIRAEGRYASQGVGYLPDGTMVMVDGAGHLIGQEADVTLTRQLQTASGYIFFGRIKDNR